tara:strand:+ start:8942 stop:11101 length:2160 start_codon:yes stop_codon:yes gene_type:complete
MEDNVNKSPYSIRTKDGIKINNIPFDVPRDSAELKQRVAVERAKRNGSPPPAVPTMTERSELPPIDVNTGELIPPTPKQPEAPVPIMDKLKGATEAAGTVISGATTGTVGGIFGFGKGVLDVINSGDFGSPEGAKVVQQAFENGMANLTFAPKSKLGKEYVKNIGEVAQAFEPLAGFSQLSALGASTKGVVDRGANKLLGRESNGSITPDLSSQRESQALLQNNQGGTLSAYQTGQASNLRNFMEHLGDLGIFSEGRRDSRNAANAITISREFQKMVDGLDTSLVQKAGDLGESVFSMIQSGNKAAGELYGKDLAEISNKFGGVTINTRTVVEAIDSWKKGNSSDLGTNLDESSLSIANELLSRLNSTKKQEPKGLTTFSNSYQKPVNNDPTASVEALMGFEKTLNNEISKKGDFKSLSFNAIATRQLSELSQIVRDSISESYSSQGFDELAVSHKRAKETFSAVKDKLLPTITKGTINSLSSKEDFNAFGKMLITATNERKIKSFMDSIDVAHDQATKAGKKLDMSATDMKQSIKQTYLDNIFGDLASKPDSVYTNKYVKIKKDLGNKTKAGAIKAVLGDDYPNYVKVVNALEIASKEQKNNLFGFIVRGAQLTKILQLGAGLSVAAGGGAIAGVGVGIGAALATLAAPNVLSFIATRPSVVNKLLRLNKLDISDPTVSARLITAEINSAINSLDEEDKKFVIGIMKEKQALIEKGQQ